VVEGEELEARAHKCILAARSPVFAAMFANRMAEVTSSSDGITVVHIDDISRPVFEALLRYIYTVCSICHIAYSYLNVCQCQCHVISLVNT
jgi:speckle-type POZ protein